MATSYVACRKQLKGIIKLKGTGMVMMTHDKQELLKYHKKKKISCIYKKI